MAVVTFPTLNKKLCIQHFTGYLITKRYSYQTIRAYLSAVKNLLKDFDDIAKITPKDINAAMAKYSEKTLASRKSALKLFFKWLSSCGIEVPFYTEKSSVPKVAHVPSDEDVQRLLAVINTLPAKKRAFFLCVYELGLKPGEVSRLARADVRSGFVQVRAKNPRMLPVSAELERLLKSLGNYMLFPGKSNTPIDNSAVHRWWKKVQEKAGVECSLHQLRRYRIKKWEKEMPVERVRELAGYAPSSFKTSSAKTSASFFLSS